LAARNISCVTTTVNVLALVGRKTQALWRRTAARQAGKALQIGTDHAWPWAKAEGT
jgi:hypothetical protein